MRCFTYSDLGITKLASNDTYTTRAIWRNVILDPRFRLDDPIPAQCSLAFAKTP
ncbi:predicted protein [Botrytis cinerea T4]|uniref:Uncharacterized protein n=1 Tax=Botryotinia fuckeliana (strain T4) TaxID=999810 RepID=G2XNJ9_BOTF4|nr:predicted protein [Botrytis cinerea T4]